MQEGVRFPAAIAFVGSFCLMVLELVAGHIMAPYLGVSLYTWTAAIGVILAGIALGAWAGGRIADTHASRRSVGALFVLAGISTLVTLYLVPLYGLYFAQARLPLPISTLVFSLLAFFPPSLFLAAITPVLVKLALHTLDRTGRTVGIISAAGALGSIVGTFTTGYVFIALVGTRTLTVAVGAVLFLLGLYLMSRPMTHRMLPIVAAFLIAGSFFIAPPCTVESQYFCITIRPLPDGYVLRLDHLVHSYVHPSQPENLGYQYERAFALLLAERNLKSPHVAFVGGGGYVLPRYLEKTYPQSSVTVYELDRAVTQVNYERLEMNLDTKIQTENGDARRALSALSADATFDAIIGDAFNDLSVPYHLTTREFTSLAARHLAPRGFYAVNAIDDGRRGKFLASIIKTFQAVFPEVILMPLSDDWQQRGRNTFVVAGSFEPFDRDRIATIIPPGLASVPAKERTIFYGGPLEAYVRRSGGVLLTDDYVPVENLLAPVFADRVYHE